MGGYRFSEDDVRDSSRAHARTPGSIAFVDHARARHVPERVRPRGSDGPASGRSFER